jgi:uncharacterized protein YqfA (UPF0365 family)
MKIEHELLIEKYYTNYINTVKAYNSLQEIAATTISGNAEAKLQAEKARIEKLIAQDVYDRTVKDIVNREANDQILS